LPQNFVILCFLQIVRLTGILLLSILVDSGFFEGVKKIFHVIEDQKELVDPYLVFNFAGRKVNIVGLCSCFLLLL